ncbi:helix-turn-helix domain-containing protein [Altererythrobacter arenosus]|uniref:Helix-turn-helix domain-containing protein n=1 Tax=Altererythrobacter arenosus TaxID=3032592 RepID=A0ABY8FQM4_9SPHN|nr:helix-turn-helix domain-containing protein [Altererythrobacter sp. CAU 1644]WFL76203.1 helix-turn-helix domain-containing protein [Altererythrobacter sp. CAU 1644]
MDVRKVTDEFLKTAFDVECGSRASRQLGEIARLLTPCRGTSAAIERDREQIVFVASGATKLVASASDNREQVVAFHFGGDIISIPADGMHAYTLFALADSTLLIFPASEFKACALSHPAVLRAMLERTQTALYRCRDKAVDLGRKNAKERLAGFLVAMSERIGRTANGKCRIELPMSRRDIGDSLGLTIETISRQFSELKQAGLIVTEGRSGVTVQDPAKLLTMAGHI